jgi:hypothetical protein
MGVITVHRVHGRVDLFDSDVEHNNFIEVAIHHAERKRNLSSNWIHGGDQIVAVRMSELQWAHFLSSFNQSEGAPVTIKHILRKDVPQPPPARPEASTFEKEVKETVEDSLTALRSATAKLEAALVPKAKVPNKADLAAILDDLHTALREFSDNVPFVEEQFGEHVEAKLAEAKMEFEGYLQGRLRQLGLEASALNAAAEDAPRPRFLTEAPKTS